jgi:hypothetical protein
MILRLRQISHHSARRSKKMGWIENVNMRLDIRYGGGDPNRLGLQAEELVRAVRVTFHGRCGAPLPVIPALFLL